MASPTVTATGTKSSVASSTSSVTILAANPGRKDATIHNNSTATLYLDLSGGTASATSFTIKIFADGYYELPRNPWGVYTGLITGIWSSANGNAQVTEFK